MLRIVTISDGIGGDYYLPFIYFIPKISTISLYIYNKDNKNNKH